MSEAAFDDGYNVGVQDALDATRAELERVRAERDELRALAESATAAFRMMPIQQGYECTWCPVCRVKLTRYMQPDLPHADGCLWLAAHPVEADR